MILLTTWLRNVDNVALYEEGRVFLPMGDERPVEQEHLAAAVTGQMVANSWNQEGSTS